MRRGSRVRLPGEDQWRETERDTPKGPWSPPAFLGFVAPQGSDLKPGGEKALQANNFVPLVSNTGAWWQDKSVVY